MSFIVRLIFGLLLGAILYGVKSFFGLRKKGKIIKSVPEEARLEILKKYGEYDDCAETKKYSAVFVLNNDAPKILQKYDYSKYFNRRFENPDDIVFAALDFVCDNFNHAGDVRLPKGRSMAEIIKASEKIGKKTNCRGLSLILAELLRMNGIKARHITCKPYEEPFSDCHVVVDCLMPSGARIMLDPTHRLYFTDDDGKYVSIERLREGIIRGEDFCPNPNASYNGGKFDYADYKEYMTKNLLRFAANFNLDDSKADKPAFAIELIPKGYSTDGFSKKVKFVTDSVSFWDI